MSDVNGLSLSRRTLLAGGSALGAAALSGAVPSGRAWAKAPMVNTQAPYFYRFKLGNFEGTVVSDGILPLGKPDENFVGLSKPEMDKQLTDNFLPLENAVLEQNALVINTGNQLVLFDTGMGSLNIFGPTTGKLLNSLKQAGIDPKDIDAVVMSHAHIDHCGGNVADDGKSNFPNAQFYITQADYDFWTTESNVPAEFKVFWETATKNLKPVRDRMHFIKDGEQILPGVHAIYATGHTVGHTIFMIEFGRQAAVLHRRSDASPGAADGEAAHRVQVRHRSEEVGAVARKESHHAGRKADTARRLPLRVARRRARGQAGRRLPLRPVADADVAVTARRVRKAPRERRVRTPVLARRTCARCALAHLCAPYAAMTVNSGQQAFHRAAFSSYRSTWKLSHRFGRMIMASMSSKPRGA